MQNQTLHCFHLSSNILFPSPVHLPFFLFSYFFSCFLLCFCPAIDCWLALNSLPQGYYSWLLLLLFGNQLDNTSFLLSLNSIAPSRVIICPPLEITMKVGIDVTLNFFRNLSQVEPIDRANLCNTVFNVDKIYFSNQKIRNKKINILPRPVLSDKVFRHLVGVTVGRYVNNFHFHAAAQRLLIHVLD